MTRRAFLKKYFARFAVSLIVVGSIVYTFYHVFGGSSGSLLTTPARKITDLQIVGGEGYLFREESVLVSSSPGVINDLAQSGSKVSKGVEVAEVWSGYGAEEIGNAQTELDRLNRMINVLEQSEVSADTTLSKAEGYRTDAMSRYLAICRAVTNGDWSNVESLEDEMLILLNRYTALTGSGTDTAGLLEALKQERTALLRGACTTLKNTESSGYYYSYDYVDGYETVFTLSALESLTAESFASLRSAEPQETANGFAAGKMVYSNRWYLAVAFDESAKALFGEGRSYSFSFPENNDKELDLTCSRILESADGSIVAVFYSDEIPPDFVYLRSQSVEITVGSTAGYYVPDAAMREENGVEGVYIFEGSTVYFRRVEVLYRGDGYCIVAEQGDRGSDYLALNDMMVTSGEKLYDGKVFK